MNLADSYFHAGPDSGSHSIPTSGAVAYLHARARVRLDEDMSDVLLGGEKLPESLSHHEQERRLCASCGTRALKLP